MSLFQKGQAKIGGRRKGTRDRISTALLEAIAKDFEEFGHEAVKIARVERPVEYLRVVASLLPKEFEITDNRLKDIPDDELDLLLEYTRQRIARDTAGSPDSGKESALN
jgi:transcriptional/translational regulatory protein YebC/TACO1